MKITKLQAYILRAPDTGRAHWVSHFTVPRASEILVRMQTDEGIEGIGMATSYTPIEAAIHAFRSGIGELIIGADPLAPEQLYQKLFAVTWQRRSHEKGWSREAVVRISAAVDIAAWDILGKVAGLPLYRLFGGYRSEVPCYVTCAYYRDGKTPSELRDEIQMLKAQGHQGFKAKGGGPDPAVRAPHEGALPRGPQARRAMRDEPCAGRPAPRLLPPRPSRRREPRRLHRRVVHRPGARSAAGRAVRGPADDCARQAQSEGATRAGPFAFGSRVVLMRRSHSLI